MIHRVPSPPAGGEAGCATKVAENARCVGLWEMPGCGIDFFRHRLEHPHMGRRNHMRTLTITGVVGRTLLTLFLLTPVLEAARQTAFTPVVVKRANKPYIGSP
jgi:hypothetical protein